MEFKETQVGLFSIRKQIIQKKDYLFLVSNEWINASSYKINLNKNSSDYLQITKQGDYGMESNDTYKRILAYTRLKKDIEPYCNIPLLPDIEPSFTEEDIIKAIKEGVKIGKSTPFTQLAINDYLDKIKNNKIPFAFDLNGKVYSLNSIFKGVNGTYVWE